MQSHCEIMKATIILHQDMRLGVTNTIYIFHVYENLLENKNKKKKNKSKNKNIHTSYMHSTKII